MGVTNSDMVGRAREVAEMSGGLRRMAALCVCVAAATTDTTRSACKALEVIHGQGRVVMSGTAKRRAATKRRLHRAHG